MFHNADIAMSFFFSLFMVGAAAVMVGVEVGMAKMYDASIRASYVPNWVMVLVFIGIVVAGIAFAAKGMVLTAVVGIMGTAIIGYLTHRTNHKARRILKQRGYGELF